MCLVLQVCLINDPRVGHDYYKLYTVQYLGNRIEGYPVRYINVPIDVLKKAAAESIKSKEVQDAVYGTCTYLHNVFAYMIGCLVWL